VNLLRAFSAAALLAGVAACGREPDLAAGNLPAVGRGPTTATLLRVPKDGGTARLYRVPALEPSSWKAQDKLPALTELIGADPEQGLVYFLDRKRNVVGLDLETHRVRTYTEQVRNALVGPDGSLFTIDTGNVVTQLVRRSPVRFRSKLQGTPQELRATMSGSLIARLGGPKPHLEILGPDQAPTAMPLAGGAMTGSLWGDLIAVAADSAVIVYPVQGKDKPRSIATSGGAKAALFSPSGHRLYVALASGDLLVLDRFSWDRLETISLPGPAVGLRGDIYGQWLLIRPAVGDSAWVFDVGRNRLAGAVRAEWDEDLPTVVSPNTLLARRGDSLVALDLGAKDFPRRGATDASDDLFVPLAWHPAQDEPVPAESDSASLAAAADSAGAAATVYLQVSSSQNPAWADELSQRLRAAGLPASVLRPKRSDEPHRVVLGPYPTREQAEEAGRRIGMPSFVVTTQEQPAP
jgi:hypothetical protein